MKRDMNLIRLLLLDTEGEEKVDLSEFSQEQIKEHKLLIYEAGFVNAVVERSASRAIVHVDRLHWNGHEFLAAARNQTVWKKAMGKVKESGGAVTFDVLKALLVAYGKDLVGLP